MSCCGYIVFDSHTGDEICDSCAKVITNHCPKPSYSYIPKPVLCSKAEAFVQDICANNNVAKCIELSALDRIASKKKCPLNEAALALYLAFKDHDVGRSVLEVAAMCGIHVTEIIKCETRFTREILPSELSARIFDPLNIDNYQVKKSINKLADLIFSKLLHCSPPQSALALAVVHTISCTDYRTKNNVSRTCGITPSCLRRLQKIYNTEILQLQTEVNQPATEQHLNFYCNNASPKKEESKE